VLGGALPAVETPQLTYDRSERVAPGVSYRERRFVRAGDGPFTLQVLEVDPAHPAINILPVRAFDRAVGKETVRSMARRYGAAAAVNGGYFVVSGPYAGVSNGVYQMNGRAISGGSNRTALLFCEETDYKERTEIDVVSFHGTVTAADGSTQGISKLNGERDSQDLVLYRSPFGPSTLTDSSGVEAVLNASGSVVRVDDRVGNAVLPAGGMVLSGSGRSAGWLREHATVGARLRIDLRLTPSVPPEKSGCKAEAMVGGGPRLVSRGKINVPEEKFAHAALRHPRTAFALTRRGTFLFVTLDGRQPSSVGMTLRELAAELIEMGAVEAMNLDGGGSTTMVVRGAVRNSPSDGKERPVSDAILIFSVPDLDALAHLIDRLANGQISANLLRKIREIVRSARGNRAELASLLRLLERAGSRDISPAAAYLIREAVAAPHPARLRVQGRLSVANALLTHQEPKCERRRTGPVMQPAAARRASASRASSGCRPNKDRTSARRA